MTKISTPEVDSTILRPISTLGELVIDACDGKGILVRASDIFPSGITCSEPSLFLKELSVATPEIFVKGYETVTWSVFKKAFESFKGVSKDKLCLTQPQIRNFCKKYSGFLWQNKSATIFLFKETDDFFIAIVRMKKNKPALEIGLINDYGERSILSNFCLLVPQPIA